MELHVHQTEVKTQMIARFGISRQLSFDHSFWAKEDCCKDKVSDQSSLGKISFGKFSFVYLYKTYYAKPLLRKYYKEGASVVTHFWVPL